MAQEGLSVCYNNHNICDIHPVPIEVVFFVEFFLSLVSHPVKRSVLMLTVGKCTRWAINKGANYLLSIFSPNIDQFKKIFQLRTLENLQ